MSRPLIHRGIVFALAFSAVAVVGCGATIATPTVRPTPTASPAGPIPVVIDTDMAADDIVAIAALLRDPGVDVRAIAVDGTGEVHCRAGVGNVQRLLDAFGRSQIPVGCGREEPGPNGRAFPDEWRAGADDMYGLSLPDPSTTTSVDAVQLIADTAAATDGVLTIVALGPWTNLADVVDTQPAVAPKLRVHAMGGALDVEGNIDYGDTRPEHGVEWNLGVDPDANAAVLASALPISLVPLDATNHVPVSPQAAAGLVAEQSAAGADIVAELFGNNPFMTSGDWYIWDALAALTLTAPDLVTWQEVHITFQQTGPSAGRLLLSDDEGRLVRAAVTADAEQVFAALAAALRRGAARP